MKCNIAKNVTDNGLHDEDINLIEEGLSLLEEDIQKFLAQGDFTKIPKSNPEENLANIASVRAQFKKYNQSFSKNELKVVYIGLNFLRDDVEAPVGERSAFQADLADEALLEKGRKISNVRQKIVAAFSRMGIDINSSLRGF